MTPEEKIAEIKKKYGGRVRIAMTRAAKKIGQAIVDTIIIRTRLEGQGTNGKLAKLSPSYIKQRKGELSFFTKNKIVVPYAPKKEPRLHPDTSPETSNLTATGQLLDALKFTSGGTKVKVFIKKTKRKKEFNGSKSGLTNDEVRAYVEKDREFLKLSPEEKEDVTRLAIDLIEEELRSLS